MSDFEIITTTAGGLAGPFRSNQQSVFIDVGAKRIEPQIERNGIPIGIHHIDPDILDDIIVTLPPVRFTIVSQSVPAGTPVPVGAAIDVTLARPGGLPIGVISGVLAPIAELTIDAGFQQFVAGRPDVLRIISRAASGTLSSADEQVVRTLFADQGIELTDAPGNDVTAAVETLSVLQTFGG
jgi:hypothetical protein